MDGLVEPAEISLKALARLPLPRLVDERLMNDVDHLLARLLGIILRNSAGRCGHLQVPPHIIAVLHGRSGILVLRRELRLLGLLLLIAALSDILHATENMSVPVVHLLVLVIGRANVGLLLEHLSLPLPGLSGRGAILAHRRDHYGSSAPAGHDGCCADLCSCQASGRETCVGPDCRGSRCGYADPGFLDAAAGRSLDTCGSALCDGHASRSRPGDPEYSMGPLAADLRTAPVYCPYCYRGSCVSQGTSLRDACRCR